MNISEIDIRAIIQGHWNALIPDDQVELIAEERMDICRECEFIKETKCGKCGCPLRAKTRSMRSKCPIDKWGAEIIITK
jgi:uncharacterized paraquat-inducible protein A